MAETRSSPPGASVVVRSFRRLDQLLALCRVLAAQDHPSFEVVIVEQTPDPTPEQLAALDGLGPSFRVLRFPPLGGPRARNEGVRAARGELVAFIDDDDLPLSTSWLRDLLAHFDDPLIVGVSCRQVWRAGERAPYLSRRYVRPRVLSYSWLKWPRTYARFDEDVAPVDWLHGTNSAIRREVALAVGLWDEHVRRQDEHSFAFRLARWLAREPGRPRRHLAFRAHPPVLRGLDVPGGMGKRLSGLDAELTNQSGYVREVVAAYFPRRHRWLRPLYGLGVAGRALTWVWGRSREISVPARLRETISLLAWPARRRSAGRACDR